MSLIWLLVVILVIAAIVGAPGIGPWQHQYGYWPSGGLGLILLIVVLFLLFGGRR